MDKDNQRTTDHPYNQDDLLNQDSHNTQEYQYDQYQYTAGQMPGQLLASQDSGSSGSYYAPIGEEQMRRQRKVYSFHRSSLLIMIVICVFVSASFGFGGAMLANKIVSPAGEGVQNTNNANTTGFKLEDVTGSKMTVQDITKKAQDSVVEIKTESVGADTWLRQYVTEGAGSGVIIKNDGYIITNNHVISGATKIKVTTSDKKEYEAKVVGADATTDVAVLKIDAQDLSAATLGNSEQLNVGDLAVAIGNPLGELGGTVTAGIISALDRSISIEGKMMSLLQTDSSINPGNSGGGLFNQYGQLIGIVVAKSSGSDIEGLGFAIPVNRAADVADQLIKNGYVKGQVTTGMSYADMSADQQGPEAFFGQNGGGNVGAVYIQEVSGANAKKAGFKSGDLVYSVDGKKIDTIETLSSVITSHEVGDTVEFVIVRNNQQGKIKLKLEEKIGSRQ